jgi:hypothetical protein
LRPNIIGIVGGILAFISLLLPWWTFTISASAMGISYSFDMAAYLYQVTCNTNIPGFPSGTTSPDVWWCSVALALIVIGGLLGIIGSIVTPFGSKLLIGGGVLTLLSVVIFAAGLQGDLAKVAGITSMIPGMSIGLFSSGSLNFMGVTLSYSTYLSFGFWIAIVAAILMFVAFKKAAGAAPITPTAPVAPPP